jgi:hypothetical protein
MQLLPVHNGDERAGFPSASEYDRLLACRASYLLRGERTLSVR